MKNYYTNLNQIKSNPDGEPTVNRQSRLMSYRGNLRNLAMIFAVLTLSIANIGMAWGAEATISATQSNDYSSSCYLIPDGTAISAIAGAGGNGFGYESGPKAKITVTASKKTATLTFTIKSGITITSFKVNGESNNNVTYDLDGTAVTIGTALTGLSKTSSMVFRLTCKDTDGSSNRNTKISSIVLTYTSDAGGGGGGGGSCYSDLAYSGGASMPTGWTIVSASSPTPQINDNTIAMQKGGTYNYSSGAPTRGMYFDADQNATISITSNCQSGRAFCLVEKNGSSYSIIQTWDEQETLTASIVSGRRYYLTSKSGSSDNAKCNITAMSFSGCASSGCSDWGFYYGTDKKSDWDKTCFTQVGSTHEWQITDFVIPDKPNWYVDNSTENDAKKVLSTWSNLYFALSQGNGSRPMVGNTATGAVGTVRIYDNSTWNNRYAGFIPDGYKLKFGSTYKDFALESGNEYRSEIVEYSSSNALDAVSVGIVDGNGDYVASANTQEMKHLFLKDNCGWNADGAKFSIYDKGAGAFKNGFMTAVPGESNLYEGWVDASCTEVIFVRHSSSADSPSWDNDWNQTPDLSLESGKNQYTLTAFSSGTWSAYTKKGKFRMWNNSTEKNWYVNFYPYNVLTYDANTGSGTMSEQSVAADAGSKNVTVLANGFTAPTGYQFDHWDTAADGSGTDYAPDATYNLTADATLYAIWTPVQYDVTLEKGSAPAAGSSGSAKVYYDAAALTNISHATWAGHVLTGYYTSNSGGTKVLNADGSFAAANVSGYITDNKWTKAENTTLKAQWTCIDFTPARGGTEDGTYTVGDNGGALTCSVAAAGDYTYKWKQYTSGQTPAAAVDAVGTGATSTSFTPHPTAAGTYYYFCEVTNSCDVKKTTSTSGTFVFNAAVTLYTVTYNVNGAGSVTPTSATQASADAAITLATPTWSGYTFEGWYNAGTKIGNGGASYTPTADITLYAHWTDNISGKVFSFIDNNYGDKFKGFDGSTWVSGGGSSKDKTYTNGTTGVQFVVDDGAWDKKNNAISSLAKFKGGTTKMKVVVPTGKIATVKISYNAYGTGNDYRLTVNSTAQANPTTKLTDDMTNAQVISSMKEITLSNQTGTLTLGISNTEKNNYIGRISAVITGYTVSYAKGSADGASGSLDSGTKTAGSSFTLSSSSSAFTRSGYTYDGWSVNENGSTKDYNLGGSYTTDAPVTLYPHWVADASATITATLLTPAYMRTGASGVQIGVEITGASTGWYYRVKKGGGYETPDNTTYTTTTWTMTSTIGAGANTYTVELYNGSGTKMAESNAVTVTGETGHPMTIAAGANGTVSPSGLIYANGEHLHPEITANPASGYHFVNWTKDNENATLANANAATTTITNASGACTITANFAADDACPTEISGGTVYKLQIKTGLTNGNLASTGTTTLTTANYLSEAITNGSASVTSPSAGNAAIADTKAICLDNGSAYITLNLDCPIQEHDIIKYTITQQNGGLYKATSRSDGNLLLQLPKTSNSSTIGQIEVTSGSKLIGKTTLYLFAKSNGAYNYYFEIIRPIKITLDATTNGGTAVDPIYGATEDKVVLPHAFKSGSRFNGWYTAASGGTKQADYYTITTGTTLFAQFTAGCAVTGTMFSLSFPSSLYPASNTTVPANSSMNLLQYATITGGAAIAENTNSSAKGSMQTNGKFVLDDAKVCVHITLDCPLQLNDVISTTIETQNLSYTATSTRSTTNYFTKGTNQTTTITADHVLLNSRDIYIWTHSSSGGKLISINISRPVGTKYSVAYDGNDMTSGSEPTDANEYDPADEVTTAAQGSLAKTNYTFGGWNTANDGTGTNTAAGSTFSITDNTTLYAKWTQAVTLDGTTNGGSDGSATAVWNATALTGITHATPAAGYKLIGYYTTATDEPTTGVKVLNASGTFSSTTVADYITSGKWSRTGEAPTLYARYEASAGLTWNLTVNAKIDLTTESKTSDYPQVGSMTDVATNGLSVSKSAKANLTSIIQTVSSLDPDKYVKATFVVASGYKFTPSKIKLKVQPKDNAETIKVVLTDGVRTYEHDFGSQSAGSIHSLEATNADADKYMQGTVTLKIYAYGNTTGYRLGTPITIEGAVTATCDMPTYTSVDHGATEYQEGDEAESLSVVGGAHVNTYQWYWNTANDRSDVSKTAATAADGTGYNTYTFTPQTTSAYSRYYWCELTATDCGTIKTEAVGITVTEVKTSASIDWTDPVGTVHYGGGGYTIKATVKETTWAGGLEDLTLSAPAGIRIYNVTRGTTDSKDWIQANFDVQTSFDRETYSSSIPFVVSAPAQTGWDAINDEHGVTYDACAGGGGEGSAFIEVTSGVTTANTGMSNYWEAAGVGRLNKAYNQAMGSSADAQTIAGHAFSYRTGANNSNWMVNTYIAGVTKIRLYFYASAAIASAKLGISKVLYDTEYFNSQGSRAVVFDNVATSADSYAAADKGWIEFTLPEMAANSYCYFATNTGNLYIYGVELFSGSVGTGGTETTNLTWSNGTVDGGSVTGKTQSSANFTITATRDAVAEKSLGAITYSSSNTSCATVDSETGEVTITATGASELTTTITATLAASGCYKKKEITYTLTIPGVTCSIETGTLTSDVTSKCSTVNATLTLTGFESGASIQWYKGESTISDDATYHITTEGTTSTLVTKEAGTYSVMVSKTTPTSCSDRSNSITISNASASASATKIVDSWYVKNGRLTPDIELWSVSEGATLGSVAWSPANETGLNCVLRDGIVYLEGKEPNANESGADKVYTLTLTLKDACGGDHEEITKTITITHQKNTDKHVLAFVVNGTKNGGFTAGISADQTTNLDLYKKISAEFDVLATNAYATDDEKALKQYYSQFDILCITDYPNTGEKGNNKKSYIDAMGSIVDIRPILTMEAFVAKWGNWKAKDISGTPHSPDPRQYAMDLQCKDHEIFDGTHPEVVGEGDEAMYRVTMVDATKEDYATLDGNTPGTDAYDADDYPALQGFEFDATMAADGLLPLGQIYNGSPTNTLQVGIERQTEMSARLMVLGIQQLAMERLTADGQTVVINALKYLMKKNEEEIADCSVAFVGGAEDGLTTDWNNDANWSTGKKPDKTTREVRILAPVVITNSQTITSPTIKIADGGTYDGGTTANGSITINAGGALKVKGEVVGVTAPAYSKKKATDPSKLVLNTSETAQSALILDNENGMTRATVYLYSLGRKIDSKYQFQYYAVPMEVVPVNPSFAGTGIYTYVWHENGGWERRGYYTDLYAFEGIGITTSGADPRTYTMAGNLASTADKEITLTKESDGENIIGNSWTAPINIASLRTGLVDDANIVDKTVYIYITGNDNMVGDHSTKEVAGKWLAIPIDASGWPDWTGQKVIPAMQAFYIKANAATTLTLNYDEMVRTTPNGELNRPLKAPHRAPLSDDAISLLKLRVEDSSTYTDLYLFEGNRFSDSYDNGWEAKQMGGDGCMQLYAQNEADKMAVLATDELEGTVVGFEPGKETGYTISFSGEGNGYYLNDVKMQTSTLISEENTYSFDYEAGDAANRFYISRTAINAPQITTGMENLDAAAPKVKKIIYNDKLYILRGGRLYDATGKVVK